MNADQPAPVHAFTTRLVRDEYEALRAYAFFIGSSINEVVRTAVRAHLRQQADDQQLDAMIEEHRVRFRERVDRMPR